MRTIKVDQKAIDLLNRHPDASNAAAMGYLAMWGMSLSADDTLVINGSDRDFPIELFAEYRTDRGVLKMFMSGFRRGTKEHAIGCAGISDVSIACGCPRTLLQPWEFHS